MEMLLLYVVLLMIAIAMKRYSPQLKGYVGEQRVVCKLKRLRKRYTSYHNVYVTKANGELTQVDHIVTSPFGIFVIETKNYVGQIVGTEQQMYWTQQLGTHRYSFYSPIFQNRAHVHALKHTLNMNVPIHSIIVFSNAATLKLPTFERATVIQLKHLQKHLRRYETPVIAPHELARIDNIMRELVTQTFIQKWKRKRRHLKQVKAKQRKQKT